MILYGCKAKDCSEQLLNDISNPSINLILYMCELFLKCYVFSMDQWAFRATVKKSDIIERRTNM